MGRHLNTTVHKHFTYSGIEDISTCNICEAKLKGNHATNLKKHLTRVHNFKQEEFFGPNLEKSTTQTQQCIDEMNIIKINMNKETLISACVELVTVNGRPFALMEDSGFKKIIDPIKEGICKLKKSKQSFRLTSDDIKLHINEEAQTLKKQIISEIKNKMVSLKIDGVTRMDRHFLGINLQYMSNGAIVLRTVALKELKSSATANYIKEIIFQVCDDFQINVSQLYTITSDNGANMIKAVKIISTESGEIEVVECEDNSGGCVNVDVEEKQENFNNQADEDENSEDEIITVQIVEDNNDDLIFEHFSNGIIDLGNNDHDSMFKTTGLRCAAHTLQLAIESSIQKDKAMTSLITDARQLIIKLRTPTLTYMLSKQNLKKPVIDCKTRWLSTLDMIESLLPLEEFCKEMLLTGFKNFKNLKTYQWSKLKDFCSTLQPAKICTKRLQYEQLTLSDFFGYWQECKMEIAKIKTVFSLLLVKHMNEKEAVLMDNDIVLTAVFLDPRYKIMLNANQIQRAKDHLKLLHLHTLQLSLQLQMSTEHEQNLEEEVNSDIASTRSSTSDDFELFLEQKDREKNASQIFKSHNQVLNNCTKKFDTLINNYDLEQQRIPRKKNILEHWQKQKDFFPEIFNMAKIVLAVPATQVSVERLFSGLKFILSPLRTNIKAAHLEQQLFVRTNRIFTKKDDMNSVAKVMDKHKLQTPDDVEPSTSQQRKRMKPTTLSSFFVKK